LDSQKLAAKVGKAKGAILHRFQVLSFRANHHEERQALTDAVATLRILKRTSRRSPTGRHRHQRCIAIREWLLDRRRQENPAMAEDRNSDSRPSVLIVDDNPEMRHAVAQTFSSDGFRVCGEAKDGKEGVDLVKQLAPDLIILDLAMPVMNGLNAAIEIRKIAPSTPIILFTMFHDKDIAEYALKVGVNLVLSKTEELSSLVRVAHSLRTDKFADSY
jgi:two-component system chemotaxis response regulator CheY